MLATLLLGAATAKADPKSWELREDGRWQEVTAPTRQAVKDDVLDAVEANLIAHQYDDAHSRVVDWLKTHRDSTIRDRGVYLLGESNLLRDDRVMAFYNFDELMDLYPASPYFYRALERQYQIADAYLNGYKNKFLGMRILGLTDEAIEMLYRIQQRSPGSTLAEKALRRSADYYYATGEYDLASDAYGAYVRSYPRSPEIPRIRLRQAFAALAQFRGLRFDATPVIDARQQLIDLAAAYPDLAREENVTALVDRIDLSLADKLMDTAAFYRRTGEPKAAAYCYRYIIQNYPSSPAIAKAQAGLKQLPSSALAEAPPLEQPTTRPQKKPTTNNSPIP